MYGSIMAKLLNLTPQQYSHGGGLSINIPATKSVEFLPLSTSQCVHTQSMLDKFIFKTENSSIYCTFEEEKSQAFPIDKEVIDDLRKSEILHHSTI